MRKLEERKEKAAKLGRPDSPKNKGKLKSKFQKTYADTKKATPKPMDKAETPSGPKVVMFP